MFYGITARLRPDFQTSLRREFFLSIFSLFSFIDVKKNKRVYLLKKETSSVIKNYVNSPLDDVAIVFTSSEDCVSFSQRREKMNSHLSLDRVDLGGVFTLIALIILLLTLVRIFFPSFFLSFFRCVF